MYDLIIIGAGPAGMTAAIYAARRKLKFLIISLDVGGQMSWSSEVDNYPGIYDSTGIQLTQRFQTHMKEYNIKVVASDVGGFRGRRIMMRSDSGKITLKYAQKS